MHALLGVRAGSRPAGSPIKLTIAKETSNEEVQLEVSMQRVGSRTEMEDEHSDTYFGLKVISMGAVRLSEGVDEAAPTPQGRDAQAAHPTTPPPAARAPASLAVPTPPFIADAFSGIGKLLPSGQDPLKQISKGAEVSFFGMPVRGTQDRQAGVGESVEVRIKKHERAVLAVLAAARQGGVDAEVEKAELQLQELTSNILWKDYNAGWKGLGFKISEVSPFQIESHWGEVWHVACSV